MKRRRFIALAVAFACAPGALVAREWRGRALGADVTVRIDGPQAQVGQAIGELPGILARVEAVFSLFDPASEVSRLNAAGGLPEISPMLREVLVATDKAHELTAGLFDPTVQPLWRALATGGDVAAARRLIGWDRVQVSNGVTLEPGMALTFNGIAQGYATDLVARRLADLGARRALVDLGEQAALGGPFRLGISDPVQGLVGWRSLRAGAVATSSPGALRLDATQGHILARDGRAPLWSTLSIEAPTATIADALSTAGVFMNRAGLANLRAAAGLGHIIAVDDAGRVRRM